MKHFCISILVFSFLHHCKSPANKNERSIDKDSIEVSFSYEESPVDFVIKDSTGFSLNFVKEKDSNFYHALRFRQPEDQVLFKSGLFNLARLWIEAENEIEIQLKSINVGYPLEYNDVLTNHIEAFSSSGRWRNQMINRETTVDHKLVEEIMLENNVYPLDDLLKDFGYRIRDIDIEKVGFVEPARLIGLGFDESLNIPVPYMVWILVEETN